MLGRSVFRGLRGIGGVRYQTTLVKTNQEKISSTMTLHSIADPSVESIPGYLVLLFPGLGTSKKGLSKYRQIYHGRGLDVLQINANDKRHLFMPPNAVRATEVVMESLDQVTMARDDKFIVHGLSMGAYVYSVMLFAAEKKPEKYGPVIDRIIGQVLDSFYAHVNIVGIGRGVAEAATSSVFLQELFIRALVAYYDYTKRYTRAFYDEVAHFLNHRTTLGRNARSLIFYSENDQICVAPLIRDLIERWRERGFSVVDKSWEQSTHGAHLHVHPIEYKETLNAFIDCCLEDKRQAKVHSGDWIDSTEILQNRN